MLKNDVSNFSTPSSRQKNALNISQILGYRVIREQFPTVPAEAITIHTSQGKLIMMYV